MARSTPSLAADEEVAPPTRPQLDESVPGATRATLCPLPYRWPPFFDYGRAWQSKGRTQEPRYISSVGIGLRWALTLRGAVPVRPSFEVYWGHALQDVETPASRRDVQDEGVHFQFVLGLF
jgi:hemolysin activation/secretion protein